MRPQMASQAYVLLQITSSLVMIRSSFVENMQGVCLSLCHFCAVAVTSLFLRLYPCHDTAGPTQFPDIGSFFEAKTTSDVTFDPAIEAAGGASKMKQLADNGAITEMLLAGRYATWCAHSTTIRSVRALGLGEVENALWSLYL